jgi:undecaprenyl-diphosphatase
VGLDRAVLAAIVAHRTEWATAAARTVADVGMSPAALPAGLALSVLVGWQLRTWRPAVAAPVAAVVAIGLTEYVKGLIGRPRPPHDLAVLTSGGFAMPSSIAAMTAAAAVPVILASLHSASRLGPAFIAVATAATVGVGSSMVYLGAHWLSDVLVGWALGAGIGAAVYRLIVGPIRRRVPDRG